MSPGFGAKSPFLAAPMSNVNMLGQSPFIKKAKLGGDNGDSRVSVNAKEEEEES